MYRHNTRRLPAASAEGSSSAIYGYAVIPAGQTTALITAGLPNSGTDAPGDDCVYAKLLSVIGATVATQDSATVVNEPGVNVSGPAMVNAGSNSMYQFAISESASVPVIVTYETFAEPSPSNPDTSTLTSGSATILAGNATALIPIGVPSAGRKQRGRTNSSASN